VNKDGSSHIDDLELLDSDLRKEVRSRGVRSHMKVKTEHRMEEGRTGMTHVLIEAVEKHLHDGNENELERRRLAEDGTEADHGTTGREVTHDEIGDVELEVDEVAIKEAVPEMVGENGDLDDESGNEEVEPN